MKPIENWQRKSIYALGGALGLTEPGNRDDNLHHLISVLTGKGSISALSYSEATAVIADLKERMCSADIPMPMPKSKKAPANERPGGITAGQIKKVYWLANQIIETGLPNAEFKKRLRKLIGDTLKVSIPPEKPFRWLDYQQGSALIQALKSMAGRQRRGDGGVHNRQGDQGGVGGADA